MRSTRCHSCAGTVRLQRPRSYPYRESGLTNVVLLGGVEIEVCTKCSERTVTVTREEQLLQVLALSLLRKPLGSLGGAEMRYLRKVCGLTQQGLANMLHVRRATVADRERGRSTLAAEGEFVFRAVVLETFSQRMREKGVSHLDRHHRQELKDLRAGFPRLPLQESRRPRKATRIPRTDGSWRIPRAA